MKRRIVEFDQDQEAHWFARLECGHNQHVRHQPPLVRRTWVLTSEGREQFIGTWLDCLSCDLSDCGEEGED